MYIDDVETVILARGKVATGVTGGDYFETATTNDGKFYSGLTVYGWSTVGLNRNGNGTDLDNFIKNSGGNYANDSEAAILFISTGGQYSLETNIPLNVSGGSKTLFFAPGNGSPTVDATLDWTKSLKWFVTDADNLLGDANDAKKYLTIWDDALQKTSANSSIPHMILGTRRAVDHATNLMSEILNKFFTAASTKAIVEAWVVDAGQQESNKGLSALMHWDNKDDLITQPTPDSADKTMRYMYWEGTDQKDTTYVVWNLPSKELQRTIQLASLKLDYLPKLLPMLPVALPEQTQWHRIDRNYFTKMETFNKGCLKLVRQLSLKDESIQVDNAKAEEIARKVIDTKAGGLPNEVQLSGISDLRIGEFESRNLHQTYKEYTRAKLVEFHHISKEKKISVDGKPDFVRVLIDASGVQAVERNWHVVIGE